MGASREGFDLFNKYGRIHFAGAFRRGMFPAEMWGDTFGRFLCIFMGHKKYIAGNENGELEIACHRCHKWLKDGK